MAQKKILISCYACSPYRGSEPGMGWSFVSGLSQHFEVHVIVEEEKFKADIQKYLEEATTAYDNLHFYFIKKKRNRKLRKIWPPSYYWFYKQWQKEAFHLAQELHKKEQFDLCHQLNMVGYREPGYLWKLDVPFVWGPIGGLQNTSWKLFPFLDAYGKLFYGGRNIYNSLQAKFLSRPKLAATRHNASIIAATPDIKSAIKTLWNTEASILTEVGTLESVNETINFRDTSQPIDIVWSGQHTPGKALNILLQSLAQLPQETNWKLHVLGVGKETEKWKQLANQLGVSNRCVWYGWLQKDEAINVMKQGHLFVMTSLKDLTSTVIIEAISLGMPVITLDHCGFSHVINEQCGVKIPITNASQITQNIASAIQRLHDDETLRQQLSKGAQQRSNDFQWNDKVDKLNQCYTQLLDENTAYS